MNFVELYAEFCFNYLKCLREASSSLHITQSQALCIQSIPYDGITQIELAQKIGIDVSTLSRNLDKLLSKEFIKKTQSDRDKRAYVIKLTKKGHQLYIMIHNQLNDFLKDIHTSLNLDEMNLINDLLNKINWEFTLRN